MRSIAVVGASLAGLHTARALRRKGFDGTVTLIGAESAAPYDRPPLSKEFLAGTVDEADIGLGEPEDDGLELDWRLGKTAVRLDTGDTAVELEDGSRIRADGIVLATGAGANPFPGALGLRTIEDAKALRERITPGTRVVLIGAGFIGAEIAATAANLGASVTIVERARVPLSGPLGAELGAVCAGWHATNGVELIADTAVRSVGEHEVELADGRVLASDVVIAGVGARPHVDWLAGSGLRIDGGVVTDSQCATGIPGVVAVGDCASSHRPFSGRVQRIEHWTNAITQSAVAAGTLLGTPEPPAPRDAIPYFWSDQYGMRLQFAGQRAEDDAVSIVDGDPASGKFAATYSRDGVLHAVLAVNNPKQFGRLRRDLSTQQASVVALA
ncbi:NAD(P)/FAD-dependent oxidoreductase [Sciscionella sediminilitoris]|uniref:NAD(P)/FAD-dependent oxidoreductase n=1 Tax=Sciscionella sediminilitoris TaxID=1445613 RepID=UPI0004DFA0B4|nr:FAD-dependent oxidoreductase [Sciscionella sp. SE31]